MGVDQKKGGRSIRRESLANDAVEGIRRNASGDIQHQQVASFSGTQVTTTGFTLQTTVPRAFASNVTLTLSTQGAAGGGGATVSGPGGDTASTAIGSNTTSRTATFTQSPATWTLSISVTTGTVTIGTTGAGFNVSREDER